jgi:hypothetical protein
VGISQLLKGTPRAVPDRAIYGKVFRLARITPKIMFSRLGQEEVLSFD